MSKTTTSIAVLACAAALAVGTAIPAAAQDTQTTIIGLVVGGTAERINLSDPNHKGVGDTLRYDFTVTNSRTIPLYFYPVSGQFDGWLYNESPGTCDRMQRTLKPGETFTCWAQHTITQADMNAGYYTPNSSWRAMTNSNSKVGFVPGVAVKLR